MTLSPKWGDCRWNSRQTFGVESRSKLLKEIFDTLHLKEIDPNVENYLNRLYKLDTDESQFQLEVDIQGMHYVFKTHRNLDEVVANMVSETPNNNFLELHIVI